MPALFFDRLPLPTLKTYTCASIVALSACVYYSTSVVTDPNWNAQSQMSAAAKGPRLDLDNLDQDAAALGLLPNNDSNFSADSRTFGQFAGDAFSVLTKEPFCVWTMINMAYCWLILLGRIIQKFVFGPLRVSEQQHVEEKFWNFVFYKFIFVFGVVNVQYIDEVFLWASWFSLLGFFHLLAQLGKDRFEYLSFSPTTPASSHAKLLGLLSAIFAISLFMFLVCIFIGFFHGLNVFAFMVAEVILLSIRTLHVILRYALHLYDICRSANDSNGTDTTTAWEKRGSMVYYIELGFEMADLIVDFAHHMHMLLWSNIFLSMASLVILMQLRHLFHEIQRRCKKHRNYLWVMNHMEQNYPMATADELTNNSDNCAVCWEKMESARKLPCSHLFHTMCLQSWLEQDKSCPTCRLALNIENPSDNLQGSPDIQHEHPVQATRSNHFFQFDGSRYVSWWPSFSVEVSQLSRVGNLMASNSQLDAMANQVQQMFPNYTISVILEDLRITRSIELTVDNILDGRITPMVNPLPTPQPPPSSTVYPECGPSSASLPINSLTISTPASTSSDVPHSWDDVNPGEGEDLWNIGGGTRFSKSPSERETCLHRRKEHLIQAARKRYFEKMKRSLSNPSAGSFQ